jgi:hypothetical protein
MSDDSLTTRVLIEIRDEIRQTNARLDVLSQRVERGFELTNERLEQTNARIDRVRTELKEEIRDVNLRTHTRLIELNAAATRTNEMLQDRFQLRDRVERCELEIDEIKKRVD